MRTMTFDVEIIRFEPERVVERMTGSSAPEAEAAVRARVCGSCCVLLTERAGEVLYDDFYIWFAGDRALLRRDEHREWFATDPVWAASAGDAEMEFRDEDGSVFTVPAAETVSRPQALDALEFWLRPGELLPSLSWA